MRNRWIKGFESGWNWEKNEEKTSNRWLTLEKNDEQIQYEVLRFGKLMWKVRGEMKGKDEGILQAGAAMS